MLADQVTSMLLSLRAQRDGSGRGITPTAVAVYGFRKLEELCLRHARNRQECNAAILRFKKSISVPVDPRRYLQLEAQLEAQRNSPVRMAEDGERLPMDDA